MGRTVPYPMDRYLDASRTLSLDAYDWTRATAHPLAPELEKAMVYMLRIEAQTLFYVRDLLNTRTAFVPEIASFLAVWLYEEERHSRIFRRFLRERGIVVTGDDRGRVRKASIGGVRERAEAMAARCIARATDHFVAVHMTWGAYNELSTIHAYELLGQRCGHPFLRELCESIAKDERRHFAFYFRQAERFLEARPAQILTRIIMKNWWKPVGFGIHAPENAYFTSDWFFGDDGGLAILKHMDQTLARLPGLGDLRLFEAFFFDAKRYVARRKAAGLAFDDWVETPARSTPAPRSSGRGRLDGLTPVESRRPALWPKSA